MAKTKTRGNGDGTLYVRNVKGVQYLEGQVTLEDGTRKTIRQRKSESKTEFKERFRNLQTSKTPNDNSKISILDILNEHTENKLKNGVTQERAYLRNQGTIKMLEKNCNALVTKPITKVKISDIVKATPEIRKYSQESINKIWGSLNKSFKIAISRKIISINLLESEEIIKPQSEVPKTQVEALTVEEQRNFLKILEQNNKEYDKILLILLYTGMRVGEVLALSKDNINFKTKKITINKTLTRDKNDKVILGKTTKTINGTREIPITPFIENILKDVLNTNITNLNNLIFFDYKDNTFITPNEINCYLKRLNTKHKICKHVHTHMLRHTYATRCIEAGVSAKVLQKLLGHSKIQTTLDTYTSVFEKFSKDENEKYVLYMKNIIN